VDGKLCHRFPPVRPPIYAIAVGQFVITPCLKAKAYVGPAGPTGT